MSEKKKVSAISAPKEIPNYSWLLSLSDEDYAKLKVRVDDFTGFLMMSALKQGLKMALLFDDSNPEWQDAMAATVMKDMVNDESMPKSFRDEIKKELHLKE